MMNPKFLPALIALLALTPFSRGAGHDLYVCAPVNSDYVIGSTYVTVSGLYHHEADGTWRHIGFNDVGIMAVAFDPRDHNTFYTATLNGLVRTFDGDKHIRVTTGWDVTEIKDVCVDPHAPDTIYLGAPDGIMVSTDRATTWERRENGLPARGKYTQTIKVDRTQAGRVLAGCETGIYLTDDAALHWRRVLPTVDTVLDIQQSPHDAKVWLAVTQSAGALISRDGGTTWTAITGLPKEKSFYNVSFDATHPQRLAVGGYTYGVMTSEDEGATWTARNAGLPDEHHVWRVAVDPDTGRLYASVRAKAIYTSDDFGRTWKSAGLAGSQVNAFVFVPKPTK
jgi:photosystem II stability/assembly factor-like uncharacterized protein